MFNTSNESLKSQGCDVWGHWKDQIKDKIPQGYSIFAEIVGYTPTGGVIQQGYSYGCNIPESRLLVYRVTFTGPDAVVFELPWLQMRGWCAKRGFETVPGLYWGPAAGLEPWLEGETLDQWREQFLKHVQETWVNDPDCPYNPSGTPAEGVVVRIDHADGTCSALKCKNFRFLEAETKRLDQGVADLEEVESQGSGEPSDQVEKGGA